MAREFGKRSYNPEEVWFSNSCSRFGERGQPWSILEHKLYKNIFLESYGNPSTAEQLSMELGIAMPYMEDELAFLVRETFLTKDGDKYQTAFPIVSADAQLAISEKQEVVKEEVAALIAKLTDDFIDLSAAHGVNVCGADREVAKWALPIKIFDRLNHRFNFKFDYPDRPDNGKWSIVGYQNADLPEYESIGQHGKIDDDPELPHVELVSYRFYSRPWDKLTPPYLKHRTAYTMYKLVKGETDGLSEHELEQLREWDYIDADNNPLIVVLRNPDYLTDADRAVLSATADKIRAILKGVNDAAREITAVDLPAYIRNIEQLLDFACANSAMGRGIIFDTLMKQGWLTCRENMPKSTGAYIII